MLPDTIEEAQRLVTPALNPGERIRFRFHAWRGSPVALLFNFCTFFGDRLIENLILYFTDDRLLVVRSHYRTGRPTEIYETYALASVSVRTYRRRLWLLSPTAEIVLAGKQQHYVLQSSDREFLDRCFSRWLPVAGKEV